MVNFINEEVVEGLQKLYTLRLPSAPAAEDIALTAQVWIETLRSYPVAWCDQDRGRIKQAFSILISDVDRWPTPRQLIQRLPQRRPLPALAQPKLSDEEIRHNKDKLGEILKLLNKGMSL